MKSSLIGLTHCFCSQMPIGNHKHKSLFGRLVLQIHIGSGTMHVTKPGILVFYLKVQYNNTRIKVLDECVNETTG